MLTFIVASVFMLQSLKIAKQMSEVGKQYLGDIYKGANAVAGWIPKAYTSGLRFGGAVAARNTIGLAGYKGAEQYRDWVGRNQEKGGLSGRAARFLTGTWLGRATDRNLQAGLGKVAGQKFFKFAGYQEEHDAELKRGIEIGNVKREQEALGEIRGKMSKKERKEFDDIVDKVRKGKTLTADEQAKLNGYLEKGGAGLMHIKDLANARLEAEIDKGRRKALKDGDKYFDKDGNEQIHHGKTRMETDEEYAARQAKRNISKEEEEELGKLRERLDKGETLTPVELARLEELQEKKDASWGLRDQDEQQKDKDGNLKFEKSLDGSDKLIDGNRVPVMGWTTEADTDYRQRIETSKTTVGRDKDGKAIRKSWRETDADVQAQGQKMPDGWLKRLYDKNPKQAGEIAPYVSHEEWLNFLKDPNVSRSIKNAAREKRFGGWADGVKALQGAVDRGEILEDSPEYGNRALELFNIAKKNIQYSDEWVDFMTSTPGEGLRKMKAAWQGSTTGFYAAAKKSGKISPSEQRIINGLKRPYLDPSSVWVGARMGRVKRARFRETRETTGSTRKMMRRAGQTEERGMRKGS